jgi:hypothetical protein
MKKFDKYKSNLSIVEVEYDKYVKSYDTLVARIEGDKLVILGWYSATTTKHINYVAQQLGLIVTK